MREDPPVIDVAAATKSRRRQKRYFQVLTIAVALWLIVSYFVAYRLTSRRHSRFPEPAPAISWGKIEPHRFTTHDAADIGAWLIEGDRRAPLVLLLHGNGGSRRNSLDRAEVFTKLGCTVMMISLRAHGDSAGDYNDLGYSARHDVIAAIEFLERRYPNRPIVIHGTSLGGAAALFAAETLGSRVRGYILESPYRDLRTAVWHRTQTYLPPGLDWLAYRSLLTVAPLRVPNLDQVSPLNAISNVPSDVPVLILAGRKDFLARVEEAEALFVRVATHGRLMIFEKAGHLRMKESEPDRFREAVVSFVDALAHEPSGQ